VAALAGCGGSRPDRDTNAAIRVRDFRGKEIRLARPARRIVCLIESALSSLYMLGAGDRVIGVSTNVYGTEAHRWYACLDPRIQGRQLPTPGNWDFVNLESVLALQPDLVILWAQQSESIAALEERGVPVFGVFLSSFADVYREVESLGVLTGASRRAGELNRWTQEELRGLQARLPDLPEAKRPGVYFMWSQGSLETSGASSTVDELIRLAGGRNVFQDVAREHMIVNLESVVAANPDVIIMWNNGRKSPSDILADPQWSAIRAVREKRVFELPEVFLCDLWTLKFQHAVKLACKWIHPERSADLNLEAEKNRILEQLYGGRLSGDCVLAR
jgi:iron complex transport system substrate-binding protein